MAIFFFSPYGLNAATAFCPRPFIAGHFLKTASGADLRCSCAKVLCSHASIHITFAERVPPFATGLSGK
jgi:hypothetical protein